MIMLIHRICMALRGFGRPRRVERVIRVSAAMLLMNEINKYTCNQVAELDSDLFVKFRLVYIM